MNKQEVFDFCVGKMLDQGDFGMNDVFEPAYHFGDKKCIVGHLIPQEAYFQEMEEHSIDPDCHAPEEYITQTIHNLFKYLGYDDLHFLPDLQNLHDNNVCDKFEDFIADLKTYAIDHDLQWNFDRPEPVIESPELVAV